VTRALRARAAAIASVVFLAGGTAAAAGLGLPGMPGWAGPAVATASQSPADSLAPDASPSPSEGASPAPTPTPLPLIGSPTSPMSAHLSGDVYGYLPYWEMDSSTEDYIDWNALSVISLFSVTQDATGDLNATTAGYRAVTSERGRRIAATARSRGVRVEIAFTTFGTDKNAAFFGSQAAQLTAVDQLRALVADVGADGVNVDAELISGTWFPAYGAFVGTLRAALRADNPEATVSVATNGSASGARMAKTAVDNGVDRVFLMGYGYRSSGSDPGAIAPLAYRGSTSKLDLSGSLDLYAAQGVPNGRIMLGLPYYGLTWATDGPALGDPATAGGRTFIPARNLDRLSSASAALQYDAGESISWFPFQDASAGTWSQTFYDTPQSLGPKYQLAIERHLAGVGIWALGYDRGLPGYWDLLKATFGPPKLLAVVVPARTRSLSIPVAVGVSPGSRAVTGLRLSANGTSWSPPVALPDLPGATDPSAVRPPLTWALAAKRDGSYRVWVQAIDEGGTRSLPRSAVVVLDRGGPTIPGPPTISWSATAKAWRARWPAGIDPSGVAGYRVQFRVGSGTWQVAAALTTSRSLLLPGVGRRSTITLTVRARDKLGNWATNFVVGRTTP
jgi:spore germination protein YaaH